MPTWRAHEKLHFFIYALIQFIVKWHTVHTTQISYEGT